eukprot:352084-Chlamydomonas_euryale.AAC.4
MPGAAADPWQRFTAHTVFNTRRCEEKAELCTLAVYQPSAGLCILKNNAFGYGGSGSQAAGLSSCLRAASGGEWCRGVG